MMRYIRIFHILKGTVVIIMNEANLIKEYKEIIIDIGKRMYTAGFVAANDGNISVKLSDDKLLVTRSGVSKGFMKKKDILITDMEGNVIEGKGKASSELKMHIAAYKNNKLIKSVCHAHSPYATAFAACEKSINNPIIAESILTLGEVPCVPYAELGTNMVADSIIPYVNTHNGVLLAHHGVVSWEKDALSAYYRLESIEHYAKISLYAGLLGGGKNMPAEDIDALIKQREKFGITITARP